MAAKTINDLTALAGSAWAADDLVPVWDTSVGETKKTAANLALTGITNATVLPSGAVVPNTLIVQQPGGTPGTDQVEISHNGTRGLIQSKDGNLFLAPSAAGGSIHILYDVTGSSWEWIIDTTGLYTSNNRVCISRSQQQAVKLASNSYYTWASDNDAAGGTADTGLQRVAAGVVGPTDGANSPVAKWFQNSAGVSRVNTASPVTNATDTMAAITGLSSTLIAGRKYAGTLTLFISTDQAAEGAKLDFDGGAGTATAFNAAVTANVQGATAGVTVSAALATDITFTALNGTGVNCIKIDFDIVCNAAGTFIPRFSQVAHSSGTLTVVAADLLIQDVP